MVKAKAGMTDEYLKGLAKTFTNAMEEAKKQDLIMVIVQTGPSV